MNDDLDEAAASDPMIVDPVDEANMADYIKEQEGDTYDPNDSIPPNIEDMIQFNADDEPRDPPSSPPSDTYCILAVHTQWLFCFKNVSPSPNNAKLSKHKLLADPHPTTSSTTKVKSKDKKNLNNMATPL
eukprot:scaffold203187_cov82-Attheya_sp.AAC.4